LGEKFFPPPPLSFFTHKNAFLIPLLSFFISELSRSYNGQTFRGHKMGWKMKKPVKRAQLYLMGILL
jgi:hypothetical protein